MPTDLKDTTGTRKGEVWGGFGIGCILKQVLTGTVCFPLGSEFGCGTDKEIGVEKEESVEVKLGGGKEGVGTIEITIGTKTTKSEKWSAKSEKCEWCKPELCFPDSRIETWTCSTVLTLYRHDYDKTYFYPGSTSELKANCAEDRKKCKCTEATTGLLLKEGEGPKSSIADGAMHTMLVRPTRFSRQNQDTAAPPDALSAFASAYYQDITSPRSGVGGAAVGIVEDGLPINWVYPGDSSEPSRVSLLSVNCGDARSAGVPAPFQGRFLPVLAIHRCDPKTTAEVVATIKVPGSPPKRMVQIPDTQKDLFTLLWTEFDLGQAPAQGTNIDLELRIKGDDGCIKALTAATYTVLA